MQRRMMVGLGALGVLAIVAGVMAAVGGGDDNHDGPAASTTTTTARTSTTTGGPDEAAAEKAIRDYFAAVLDKDCPTMIRVATETMFTGSDADKLAACQQALAKTDYKARGYHLDGLKVLSHQGDTVAFTTYERMDGQLYSETAVVTRREGSWKIDRMF